MRDHPSDGFGVFGGYGWPGEPLTRKVPPMAVPLQGVRLKGKSGLKVELVDLAPISILVGPNGVGKSRLIRGIETAAASLPMSARSRNRPAGLPEQDPELYVGNESERLNILQEIPGLTPRMPDIAQAIADLGQPLVSTQPFTTSPLPVVGSPPPTGLNEHTLTYQNGVVVHNGIDSVATGWWSSGTIEYASVLSKVETAGQQNLLLLDEFGHSLHPSAQRTLFKKLEDWVRAGNSDRQIIAATHSPTLIAMCARCDVGRIYPLEQLVGTAGHNKFSSGLSGGEAHMYGLTSIGADFSDVLPRHYVIAEQSVCSLLEHSLKKSFIPALVTSNGDATTLNRAKSLFNYLENSLEFVGRQPGMTIAPTRVVVVIDSKVPTELTTKVSELRRRHPNLVIVEIDSGEGLEDVYPLEVVNRFLQSKQLPESALATGTTRHLKNLNLGYEGLGKLKRQLAEFVCKDGAYVPNEDLKLHDLYLAFTG